MVIFSLLALVAITIIAGLVALYCWLESKMAAPIDADKFYFPPRAPGLAGYFTQHLTLTFDPKRDAFQFQLDSVAEARRQGKKAVFFLLSALGRRILPVETRDAQYMLVGNASNYEKPADPYQKIEFILGTHNLVTMRDEALHTVHRNILAPCFSAKLLAEISDTIISKNVEECMENVRKGFVECPDGRSNGSDKLDHYFSEEALGIISEAAFRQRTVDGIDVGREFEKLQNLGAGNFMYVQIPLFIRNIAVRWIPAFKKTYDLAQASLERLRAATAMMVKDAKKRGPDDQKSVVDILAHEKTFDEEIIGSHAVTMISAGHETTSKGLAFTAYLLAWNPRAQDLLFDELEEVVHSRAVPNLEDIKDLPYLNAVLKESLRLLPPVPAVARVAVKDDVLPSGLKIRAGETVIVSPMVCHYDPNTYGADVDEFKPERWLNGGEEEIRRRGGVAAHIPFLAGRRDCIGRHFAMNEMLLTIATLVRRYRIEKIEGDSFPSRVLAITLRPFPAKKLRLILRENI